MALKDLNAAAMIAVSGQWLQQDRAVLASQPALLHPLERIEEAHETLLMAQKRQGTVEKAVMELTQSLTAEDAYHDRKLRGVYYVLTGNAEIADDPRVREQLLAAREALFPLGLSSMQRTYREQAGNGKIAEGQFVGEVQASCDSIVLQGVSLSQVTRDWLGAAQRIGDMNAQRNRIAKDEDDGIDAGEQHQARLAWIKAVNALLAMLDFTDFDADTRRRLLADLRDAEAKAARSRASASGSNVADASDADGEAQGVAGFSESFDQVTALADSVNE